MPCPRCGDTDTLFDGYCDACNFRFGCTCCHAYAEQCGCQFTQTGTLYYDCQQHQRVVRFVADAAPVVQAPRYFRL